MKAYSLKSERLKRGWGQVEAARRLGVSQPYLAMLEQGKRPVTPHLMRRATSVYGLPLMDLPVPEAFAPKEVEPQRLVEHLSKLDYPGFAYVRPRVRKKNPAEVLLTALSQRSLEARVGEALPWVLLHYWEMNPKWLVEQAKRFDLQNRLGFVADVAYKLSTNTRNSDRTNALLGLKTQLNRSRLAQEDYFPRPPRNDAEREWMSKNRSKEAQHWNLLTDFRPEHLQYAE